MPNIAHSLRHLREAAGISQTAARQAVGISGGHLSEIERGETDPRLGTVEALLALYGYRLAVLPIAEQSELTALDIDALRLVAQAGHNVVVGATSVVDDSGADTLWMRLQQLERTVGRYWQILAELGIKEKHDE